MIFKVMLSQAGQVCPIASRSMPLIAQAFRRTREMQTSVSGIDTLGAARVAIGLAFRYLCPKFSAIPTDIRSEGRFGIRFRVRCWKSIGREPTSGLESHSFGPEARKAAQMDGKIDLLTLISLIVAVVLVLKLRSVLGRRTDDDAQRVERARAEQQRQARAGGAAAGSDKVVTLPRREREEQAGVAAAAQSGATVAEAEERIRTFATDPLIAKGLLDILKLDPSFNPEHFVGGAKAAYEMIVTAFAEGNRKALKGLLNRDVFDGFSSAITDREARGEIIDQSFVGINKADILEAEVKGGIASVTVRFVSQLISATRDRGGAVISGDPQKIKEVTDIWTFSRDVSTSRARQDPNWRLIATQASN